MKGLMVIISLFALLGVGVIFAQPTCFTLYSIDPEDFSFAPVDSTCCLSGACTHPVADGILVELWWDRNPAGRGPEDTLAPIGGDEGFSYNRFPINGGELNGVPGTFASPIFCIPVLPSPARFYLFVSLPENERHTISFNLYPGQVSDFMIGLRQWVCEPRTDAGGEPPAAAPANFWLAQNYPNPFNPGTAIAFSLPAAGRAKLTVFDVAGRTVATPVDGFLGTGVHVVAFSGLGLASGTYIYVIEAPGFIASKKMVLVR